MANILKIKRSTTSGNTPTLSEGELGVNIEDEKLWVGDGSSNILLNPSASTYLPLAGGTLTGQLTLSSATPKINLTDTDTNCDSFISADSGAGGLSISADVNDEGSGAFVDLKTGNASRLILRGTGSHNLTGTLTVSGTVFPATNLGYDLGSSALRWNSLYANTGSFTGALTGTTATFSGSASSAYIATIKNTHATAGYGLRIEAGDDGNVSSLSVADKDGAEKFRVRDD